MYQESLNISLLVGKTLKSVLNDGDDVWFETNDGEKYKLTHYQDCCENVSVEDVIGDLQDLLGSPVLEAEEVSNAADPEDITRENGSDYSHTWTFYKLGTIKGSVTIRWYGESNGYYSESVDFVKVA